jgi:hypothetical protein
LFPKISHSKPSAPGNKRLQQRALNSSHRTHEDDLGKQSLLDTSNKLMSRPQQLGFFAFTYLRLYSMPLARIRRPKQRKNKKVGQALRQQHTAAYTPGVATESKNSLQANVQTLANKEKLKETSGRRKDSVAAVDQATEESRLAPVEARKESTGNPGAAGAQGSVQEGMSSKLRTPPPRRSLHPVIVTFNSRVSDLNDVLPVPPEFGHLTFYEYFTGANATAIRERLEADLFADMDVRDWHQRLTQPRPKAKAPKLIALQYKTHEAPPSVFGIEAKLNGLILQEPKMVNRSVETAWTPPKPTSEGSQVGNFTLEVDPTVIRVDKVSMQKPEVAKLEDFAPEDDPAIIRVDKAKKQKSTPVFVVSHTEVSGLGSSYTSPAPQHRNRSNTAGSLYAGNPQWAPLTPYTHLYLPSPFEDTLGAPEAYTRSDSLSPLEAAQYCTQSGRLRAQSQPYRGHGVEDQYE